MIIGACRWLLVCCVPLCMLAFDSQKSDSKNAAPNSEGTSQPLILTGQHTSGSFPVPPEVLRSQPRVLFVSIAKVVNPQRTSFEILAYFERTKPDQAPAEKILLSSFSLYPSDQPAGFQLSTSEAFHKLATEAPTSKQGDIRVVFEIRRFHETDSWTGLELTLAPPVWRNK
jgi:hypothetical protein